MIPLLKRYFQFGKYLIRNKRNKYIFLVLIKVITQNKFFKRILKVVDFVPTKINDRRVRFGIFILGWWLR